MAHRNIARCSRSLQMAMNFLRYGETRTQSNVTEAFSPKMPVTFVYAIERATRLTLSITCARSCFPTTTHTRPFHALILH